MHEFAQFGLNETESTALQSDAFEDSVHDFNLGWFITNSIFLFNSGHALQGHPVQCISSIARLRYFLGRLLRWRAKAHREQFTITNFQGSN
jgi:hypothetical protein